MLSSPLPPVPTAWDEPTPATTGEVLPQPCSDHDLGDFAEDEPRVGAPTPFPEAAGDMMSEEELLKSILAKDPRAIDRFDGKAPLGTDAESFMESVDEKLARLCKGIPTDQVDQHDPVTKPVPGFEGFVESLDACMMAGDVDLRGGVGQQFTKWLRDNVEKAEEYKALKAPGQTRQLKKNFRLAWAADMKVGKTVVVKQKLQLWEDVNEELGVYEPFERIVELEGGRHSANAITAAMKYYLRALTMGGHWRMANLMTDRIDVLYIKKTSRKIFSQKWSILQQHTEVVAQQAQPHGVATPVKSAAPVAAIAMEVAAGPLKATTPRKRGKGGSSGQNPNKKQKIAAKCEKVEESPDEKKKAANELKQASEVKRKYKNATASHIKLIEAIEEDPKYAWANTPVILGQLENPFNDLKGRIDSNSFNLSFMLHAVPEVKKRFALDFAPLLIQFSDDLHDRVNAVLKAQTKFVKMHAVKCED